MTEYSKRTYTHVLSLFPYHAGAASTFVLPFYSLYIFTLLSVVYLFRQLMIRLLSKPQCAIPRNSARVFKMFHDIPSFLFCFFKFKALVYDEWDTAFIFCRQRMGRILRILTVAGPELVYNIYFALIQYVIYGRHSWWKIDTPEAFLL